ncbi:hypothetical protein PV733_08815 [Streptomyces europaeiscabiei]|uniref:hypothetical protein n=1 Tax=Streptomyces europaeiscabiei TaxID=146819 RepID=UPI0029A0D0E7|nr:hypothetical protein [Streptomyces europaeiscabiei]MDX3709067.1 hypothetical protein [Streptomyces europaeiscabiei]
MVKRISNDLSGSVTGHVVQAGAVHGDVVFDAATQARIAHARSLKEERISAYRLFLQAAEALSDQLQEVAQIALDIVEGTRLRHELILLSDRLNDASVAFEQLRTLTRGVQLVGPESAYEAARSVSAASVALHLSCRIAWDKVADVPRRWQRNHERFREGLPDRLSRFRDEVRRVREAPPV